VTPVDTGGKQDQESIWAQVISDLQASYWERSLEEQSLLLKGSVILAGVILKIWWLGGGHCLDAVMP